MAIINVPSALQPMAGSFEKLAVSTSVVPLTSTKYFKQTAPVVMGNGGTAPTNHVVAQRALVTVETNSIRWTVDGTTPDATTGHVAAATDVIILEGYDNIRAFKCIRASADGTISVTYFRN